MGGGSISKVARVALNPFKGVSAAAQAGKKLTKRIPVLREVTDVASSVTDRAEGIGRGLTKSVAGDKAANLAFGAAPQASAPDVSGPAIDPLAEANKAANAARATSAARRRRTPGRGQTLLTRKRRGSSVLGRTSGSEV